MKKIFTIFVVVLCSSTLALGSVIISDLKGEVEIRRGEWVKKAEVGTELEQNDRIKTSEGSSVELTFDDGSKILLTEDTEIGIAELADDHRTLSLIAGKISGEIVSLESGQTFDVRTPSSLAEIGGSEFIMAVGDEGTKVLTLSGEIEFENFLSGEKIEIVEGQGSFSSIEGEITPAQEIDKEVWIEDLTKVEPGEESGEEPATVEPAMDEPTGEETKAAPTIIEEPKSEEFVELQEELANFVEDAKTDVEIGKDIGEEPKKNDFSTGRALKDVHGNLVQVEEWLFRPDSKTVKLIHLTKRIDGYKYNGEFTYNGENTTRIDSMELKTIFDRDLPGQLTEWSDFFDSQKPKVEMSSIKISNGIDIIESKATRKIPDYVTLVDGIVNNDSDMEGTLYINGEEVDFDCELQGEAITADGGDNKQAWATVKDAPIKLKNRDYIPTGETTDGGDPIYEPDLYLYTEIYGINNDGSILDEDVLRNEMGIDLDNLDPLKIVPVVKNEIAFEPIIFCKEVGTGEDFFAKGNIDLVFTPNIYVSVAETVAPELIYGN